ncbi:MAG: ATP-binding cassette domain-containing protein [Planctomycetes bacterium]|nr:ATP-binding cassette domain-containing protein [Planctomycetota bacterium]
MEKAPVLLRLDKATKRFGARVAVADLDLEVRRGEIYGFLGLNGAGKTTSLRMALGLIRPSSGRVFVYGRELLAGDLSGIAPIGALIEGPAFYPYLSGADNLRVLARIAGAVSEERIREVVARVGLAGREGDKVRGYSQGMRQRLGIAQALLARPELVLLDEPTNGLDPQGIADIRALLRRLHDEEGMTFLLSSHLLSEVELIATRVAILKEGRLVVEGTIRDLLDATTSAVRLRATPAKRARELVAALPWCQGIEPEGSDGLLIARIPQDRTGEVTALLVRSDVTVHEIAPRRMTLEEYFLSRQ